MHSYFWGFFLLLFHAFSSHRSRRHLLPRHNIFSQQFEISDKPNKPLFSGLANFIQKLWLFTGNGNSVHAGQWGYNMSHYLHCSTGTLLALDSFCTFHKHEIHSVFLLHINKFLTIPLPLAFH